MSTASNQANIICQQQDLNTINDPGSKGFTLNGESVFAVKKNNLVYFYRNRCPHLGIELEWVEDQFLDYDQALIQCASHGALFVIENGDCVAGPCQGQQLEPIPYRIENGLVIAE